MTPRTRTSYFALWTRVLRAQGWDKLPRGIQEERRRQVTRAAMTACRAGDTDSTTRLDDARVTALFTYLRHLADPDNLTAAKLWTDCMADFVAFNMSKQADFHQRRAYGRKGPQRLVRDRFEGRAKAAQPDFTRPLSRTEAEQRLLTTRARAEARQGRYRSAADRTPEPLLEPVSIDIRDGIECPF